MPMPMPAACFVALVGMSMVNLIVDTFSLSMALGNRCILVRWLCWLCWGWLGWRACVGIVYALAEQQELEIAMHEAERRHGVNRMNVIALSDVPLHAALTEANIKRSWSLVTFSLSLSLSLSLSVKIFIIFALLLMAALLRATLTALLL